MGYKIKQLWARADRYTAGGNTRKFIVIHNTANVASAANEAKNLHNNAGQSSFQYTLDDVDIYQCVHDYDTAWAVGAWKGATAYIRNNQSISIEVCSPGTEFTAAEKDRLHWLVRDLMEYYDIPADHVVRHWDCHSGHKACPAYYAGSNNSAWKSLHALITSPYGEVDGEVEQKKPLPDALKGFRDLDSEAWYIEAVENAVKNKWMNGYDGSTFGPNDKLTRAQAVCILANYGGAKSEHPYSDVKPGTYYYDAVLWAKENGIINGELDEFRPDDPCTRQEFVAMLYNWKGEKPVGEPAGYTDWNDVADWAKESMAWGVEKGIMSGNSGKLRPDDACTRAEAAAMITNFNKM